MSRRQADHYKPLAIPGRAVPISRERRKQLRARLRQLRAEWRQIGADDQIPFPSSWKRSLWDKQEGRCAYCHMELSETAQVDHVIPRARGGPDHPTNYVLACPTCNQRKSATHPVEWLERIQWSPLP